MAGKMTFPKILSKSCRLEGACQKEDHLFPAAPPSMVSILLQIGSLRGEMEGVGGRRLARSTPGWSLVRIGQNDASTLGPLRRILGIPRTA